MSRLVPGAVDGGARRPPRRSSAPTARPKRDFLYVEDAVRAFLAIAGEPGHRAARRSTSAATARTRCARSSSSSAASPAPTSSPTSAATGHARGRDPPQVRRLEQAARGAPAGARRSRSRRAWSARSPGTGRTSRRWRHDAAAVGRRGVPRPAAAPALAAQRAGGADAGPRERWEVVVAHDSRGPETEALLRDHPLGAGRDAAPRPRHRRGSRRRGRTATPPGRGARAAGRLHRRRLPPAAGVARAHARRRASATPARSSRARRGPTPTSSGCIARQRRRSQHIDPPVPWAQACNIAYPREVLEAVGGFDAVHAHAGRTPTSRSAPIAAGYALRGRAGRGDLPRGRGRVAWRGASWPRSAGPTPR